MRTIPLTFVNTYKLFGFHPYGNARRKQSRLTLNSLQSRYKHKRIDLVLVWVVSDALDRSRIPFFPFVFGGFSPSLNGCYLNFIYMEIKIGERVSELPVAGVYLG